MELRLEVVQVFTCSEQEQSRRKAGGEWRANSRFMVDKWP